MPVLDRQELDRLAAQLILGGWEITSRWEPRDLPPDANAVLLEARQGPVVLEIMTDDSYLVHLLLASGPVATLPEDLAAIDLQIRVLPDDENPEETDPDGTPR